MKQGGKMERKELLNVVSEQLITITSSFNYSDVTPELIKEMKKDIHIAEPLDKLKRNTAGREWGIIPVDEDNKDKAIDIEKMMSDLNMQASIKYINDIRVYGYGAFEIVWGEDFNPIKLIEIPQTMMVYEPYKKQWQIKTTGGVVTLDDPYKFIVVTHEATLDNIKGKSVLESCIPSYEDKKSIRAKLRGIAERYGDIITIFAYDEQETDEQVQEKREKFKELYGKDAIGVPLDDGKNLKDWVDFIKLSDLETEIHQTLEDRWRIDIQKYILGADYSESQSATGSQARDEIQQKEQEKVEEEICKFARDTLQQLLKVHGELQGYDGKSYYFKFEKERDQVEEAELEKTNVAIKKEKAETLNILSQAGYKLSKEEAAKMLGVPVEALSEIELTEFAEGKSAAVKKKERNNRRLKTFKEWTEDSEKRFSESLSKQVQKQFKAMTKVESLNNFNFDMEQLENDFILGVLNGKSDELEISTLQEEFAEFAEDINPYEVPFSEAIEFFLSKSTELYKDIEPITLEVRANFHWIKKSTELETTKKLMDNLERALEKGETFADWKKRSKDVLEMCGFGDNAWYLNNVYRTNLLSSYSVGRYEQQKATAKRFPYWQYDATMDSRTSEICRELDGKVYKSSDSIWNDIYPPSHYQCRSGVISISKEEFEEEGMTLGKKPNEEFLKDLDTFRGNPGQIWEKAEKSAKKKEKEVQKSFKELEG